MRNYNDTDCDKIIQAIFDSESETEQMFEKMLQDEIDSLKKDLKIKEEENNILNKKIKELEEIIQEKENNIKL